MPLELHRDLVVPADETILSRYMDFAKFVDLLERQVLWFPRADQFDDPLEGTWTDAEIAHLRSLDASDAGSRLQTAAGYLNVSKHMRSTAYVSCWREAAGESMAMWDLYGKGRVVAVKSTVEKLKLATAESQFRTFLGRVKYIDWSLASWDNNTLAMCFRKDLSYQHEAELRAVIWDQAVISQNMSDALVVARSRRDYPNPGMDPFLLRREDGRRGIEIPFAVGRFITEVVVGPREQTWVARLVRDVLKRYELDITISVSDRLKSRLTG